MSFRVVLKIELKAPPTKLEKLLEIHLGVINLGTMVTSSVDSRAVRFKA